MNVTVSNRLQDKIVVITGAASGIGAFTAQALASHGAKVVLADIDFEQAEINAKEIRASGGATAAVALDLADEDSIREMIAFVVSQFGGIDVLFNNAAATQYAQANDGPVATMDSRVWDKTMQINLRGPMLAIKYATPHMIKRGGGSIINMSSGAALAGATDPTAYAVSKAGIIALTQYVATQLGKDRIRCNAISPGMILTPATEKSYAAGPIGEMMLRHHLTPYLGKPADIAWAVVWLASDESPFVTGQTISIDGGFLAHQPYYADARVMSSTT